MLEPVGARILDLKGPVGPARCLPASPDPTSPPAHPAHCSGAPSPADLTHACPNGHPTNCIWPRADVGTEACAGQGLPGARRTGLELGSESPSRVKLPFQVRAAAQISAPGHCALGRPSAVFTLAAFGWDAELILLVTHARQSSSLSGQKSNPAKHQE